MKAIFDADDDRRGKWYGALSILRRFAVNWAYLVERGRSHAPNRVLSLLLYATDAGIAVPEEALLDLAGTALQAEGSADAVLRPSP